LLYDGTEALIGGFDPITPLKPHLGESYFQINRRLQAAVNQRYDLPPWTVASHQFHKHADRLAAASEALHVVGWRRAALRRTLGIMLEPLDQDPLTIRQACRHGSPGRRIWRPNGSKKGCVTCSAPAVKCRNPPMIWSMISLERRSRR
jgi:hypothetical protein